MKLFPHVVTDTTSPLALKAMVRLIEAGKSVAIFPEGRMTVTGSLMKVYDGLAFLASRTGASLLPVAIDGGVHSIFSSKKHSLPRRLRPRVRLKFYPVRSLEVPDGRTARDRRRAASRRIRLLLEQIWFEAQPPTTLFQALLDAIRDPPPRPPPCSPRRRPPPASDLRQRAPRRAGARPAGLAARRRRRDSRRPDAQRRPDHDAVVRHVRRSPRARHA
jgi:hypothetical protein